MTWHPQVYEQLLDGNYQQVANFYEQLIEEDSDNITAYWYLGLAYLLQQQETEAETTWLYVLAQGSETEIQQWTNDLVQILETEARHQESLDNYRLAWLIRGHIHEYAPTLVNNVLSLLKAELKLNLLMPENLRDKNLELLFKETAIGEVDSELLIAVIPPILLFMNEELLNGLEASLPHLPQLDILIESLEPIFSILEQRNPLFGASLTKILLESEPNNLYLLKNLFWYYTYAQEYQQAWELGKQIYEKAEHISLKVFTNYQILEMLLSAGHWLEAEKYAQLHQELLTQTIQENICPKFIKDAVLSVTRPLMYLEDKPVKNRSLHNQIARLFQEHTRNNYGNYQWWHQAKIKTDKKLKIGYIANSLRKHSVGWLSRWLFKYHNRDDFTINLYLVNQLEDRVTQQWFRQNADTVHALPANTEMVAERIKEDRIDILVDLDSITHHVTCQVMALKPAPIQITWLGLDASGIPSIDYFMADPYVLPKNAQNYYQETIWRLPHTYIAVDGFEVNLPTLRRNHLDIPDDAIIYLTAQSGFKRHPEHIRSSMQIIKQVPHSYLLIKGLGDQEKIQQIFTTIAQQEDVSEGRLRFLARDSAEEIHRANLQIADVVLDTYPYNGATTTLETLWMGIPLVTKVGKQFAARNSYAFMMNVGVTEGIAWTDEEYIKWGIKLGTEEKLRQQVAWKLSQSRKTSPLWNAQQFTREIEKAYQKMWDKYIKLSI